jgi:hypothetical protein
MASAITDRELKGLMRGQPVNAGVWVWAVNDNVGQPLQFAHEILRLDPADPDIEELLSMYHDLLVAYGYKIDGRSSEPAGTRDSAIDREALITGLAGSLRSDSTIIHSLNRTGTLPAYNRANDDGGRLAAILNSLWQPQSQ